MINLLEGSISFLICNYLILNRRNAFLKIALNLTASHHAYDATSLYYSNKKRVRYFKITNNNFYIKIIFIKLLYIYSAIIMIRITIIQYI